MMMPDLTVQANNFVRFLSPTTEKTIFPVETRNIDALPDLPEECAFYFFDSFVGVVNDVEYRFGPELNVSPKFYKGSTYFPNPEHFRVFQMRSYGWSEDEIFANWGEDSLGYSTFGKYTKKNFPSGILIVNGTIVNPVGGIILSVKETITSYAFPAGPIPTAYGTTFE